VRHVRDAASGRRIAKVAKYLHDSPKAEHEERWQMNDVTKKKDADGICRMHDKVCTEHSCNGSGSADTWEYRGGISNDLGNAGNNAKE
jgi:hypothetical protein